MSYYVKRYQDREGWTGPIRSPKQAEKERAAWESVGWAAEVVECTPETRAQVRAWTKERQAARNR